METIFALASAEGRAGVAVIRVSGPHVSKACEALGLSRPKPRYASLQKLRDGDGGVIDEALVLYFKDGASFTGEEVLELHVHGGRAIVSSVFGVLSCVENCRFAKPGEFTRRAVESGRLDLARAEGLIDLIDSETEVQRKQAVQLYAGGLSSAISELRRGLLDARSLLEASIDFADEEVPEDVTEPVLGVLTDVVRQLQKAVVDAKRANSQRDGFRVAIIGSPNVGKSTLLNYIAGREVAIASEFAGTTRDVIEVKVELDGQLFIFMDTAGIRQTTDVVERIGVERAVGAAEQADLRVFLLDDMDVVPSLFNEEIDIRLVAKDDEGRANLGISGVTGAGVERLLSVIVEKRKVLGGGAGLGNERHLSELERALAEVRNAQEHISVSDDFDLGSEAVRNASVHLAKITGDIGVEDVLGSVFSRFCIGK